jgi:nucleoside-triphosphatase THEP1
MFRHKNILLTGRPGVGKTTALMAIIQQLGPGAGGFYTAEVRSGGDRSGFEILTLSGEHRVMASKTIKSAQKVGSYGVDVDAVDRLAAGSIDEALKSCEIIVIDEIGKMELFSDRFRASVISALDSEKPVLGVIMERSHPFADAIKARSDVKLVEVTLENRNTIPGVAKKLIEK